jgi:hypothetical protein
MTDPRQRMKLNIKHGAYSIFFCQIDNINFSCLCAQSKSRWEVGVKKGDESYRYPRPVELV